MSDATVRGHVHLIEETKTFGQNGFRKRLVVLEQGKARFTNYVPVEFVHEGCDSVDSLNVGDEIDVTYRLNGRRWQKDANSEVKFFLNAEAISFKVVDGSSAPSSGGGGGNASGNASADDVNSKLNEAWDESDDEAPF